MENFVKSTPSKRRHSITAQQRCEQFGSQLYERGGKLFCSACNVLLDHVRKSTIIDHLKSKIHMKRRAEFTEQSVRKQRTLMTSRKCNTVARVEKIGVVHDFVKMCIESGIPLEKANHPSVRAFLLGHVKNGGAIPQADQLRKAYLPDVYKEKHLCMSHNIAGKKVAIILEKTSDVEQRNILNILAVPTEKDDAGCVCPYLLDSKFLSSVSHSTVTQAVVKTILEHGISFNDVRVFDTENAPYMRKCYSDVLQALFPNSVHITCLAHITNVLVSEFEKPFPLTLSFMKLFRKFFSLGRDRKDRYLQHLREAASTKEATMPPEPCSTRWSYYLRAAAYHRDHVLYQKAFMEKEIYMNESPCATLSSLKNLLCDDQLLRLRIELSFLADKSTKLCDLLDRFQPHIPDCSIYFNLTESPKVPLSLKMEMQEKFKRAFSGAASELKRYMSENGQSGHEFLKAVRIFDPTKIPFLS
uniref:DUF659 domain-containing protein n=1 Tax=Latimeria chalumnae TaxID=7897 RepID=H3AKW3_LATCH